MTVRLALGGDAEGIVPLCGQLGHPILPAEAAERLESASADACRDIYVAVDGDHLVGWIEVVERDCLASGRMAEIIGLVVDQEYRRRGIASALIGAAENWAKGRGHTTLRVRTRLQRAEAHSFYERLGFSLTKEQRVYDKPI